jgi:hypothetical protein
MAQLLTLQNTIKWALPILKNQPLEVNGNEPALTFGNFILQRMTGPPFRWRFNRKNFSFAITEDGGTDYQVNISDLGHIEKMWFVDSSGNVSAITVRVSLEVSGLSDRPTECAPVYDNNNGLITFRLKPNPNIAGTIYGDYQAKPGLILSLAYPWGTVPDEFSYVYDAGYLSMAMMLVNDARFPIWERYFIANLLGAQEGLDQQAMSIFLAQWTMESRTLAASMATQQAGASSRGI